MNDTNENQLNWGNVVDTNDDGVVSEKELDTALDGLADLEEEATEENTAPETEVIAESDVGDAGVELGIGTGINIETPIVDIAEEADVSSDPITDTVDNGEELEFPTVESLSKKLAPSANENDLHHRQHWAAECSKFADKNGYHFLGFAIKDGEPMFKEIK